MGRCGAGGVYAGPSMLARVTRGRWLTSIALTPLFRRDPFCLSMIIFCLTNIFFKSNMRYMKGSDIKQARNYLIENQKEFAVRFGVSQATIARWERDKQSPSGSARIILSHFFLALKRKKAEEDFNA
jgi:DNA-binding XRE family transcriptional regulator